MGILLNGSLHRNNSIISPDSIGEESKALLCITNNITCCRRIDTQSDMRTNGTALGNWYYPDGTAVNIKLESVRNNSRFYKNRGPSVVRLHRRQTASDSGPSGIYNCTIPDNNSNNLSIFVGVYPEGQGENEICTYP